MNFHNIYSVACFLCITFDQSNYFIQEILNILVVHSLKSISKFNTIPV